MIIDIEKVYSGITERLDYSETTSAIAAAVDRITSILNNPFISKINGINEEITFSKEIGDDYDYIKMTNIFGQKISVGMTIIIEGTDLMDGAYIVKDIGGNDIIFWNKANYSTDISETANWYIAGFPFDMTKIVIDVIEIMRQDMADIAGLSSIQQGVDSKMMKSGSQLRHYIVKVLDGYFLQPDIGVMKYKLFKEGNLY